MAERLLGRSTVFLDIATERGKRDKKLRESLGPAFLGVTSGKRAISRGTCTVLGERVAVGRGVVHREAWLTEHSTGIFSWLLCVIPGFRLLSFWLCL